ncbi:MAG: hypothetical protein IBJ13_03020 [Sphingopyxis sp.]|nr:hypothetical protein [Sphingopyxis sp.]
MVRLYLAAILFAMPALPAQAQDDGEVDTAAIRAMERAVPPQDWYPDGYRDIRIAAEAQATETLRSRAVLVGNCADGGGQCYNLWNPIPQRINPGEADPMLKRYGNTALEVARLRQEFELLGYPRSVYDGPLASYERGLVEAAGKATLPPPDFESTALRELAVALDTARLKKAAKLPRVVAVDGTALAAIGEGGEAGPTTIVVVRASGPSAAGFPAGKLLGAKERIILRAGDKLVLLSDRGTRTLTGPGVFAAAAPGTSSVVQPGRLLSRGIITRSRTGAVKGPRPSGQSVIVSTSPPGGEVLLVSAFAFRICARKQANSWDRFACKWNEIETGVEQGLAGRYVYQVKWPDGVVRKGTREIVPDYDGDEAVAVTFKKVGS